MNICLLDTSVLCEILQVPGKNSKNPIAGENAFQKQLKDKIRAKEKLLLPMAAIIETGNHIGQHKGDGGRRRKCAERFVTLVKDAIAGTSPFVPTPFMEPHELLKWLDHFADHATSGVGLGDLSIRQEWERQRRLHPSRRVYVWTLDKHLASYDTGSPRR